MPNALAALAHAVAAQAAAEPLIRVGGTIVEAAPGHLRADGIAAVAQLGDPVTIATRDGTTRGEIIRLDAAGAIIKPFDEDIAVRLGAAVWRAPPLALRPGTGWQGRAVNALGQPIDGRGPLPAGPANMPLHRAPPDPLARRPLDTPVRSGVRAIDVFTPLCAGQRIGLFAGSGVGKSTLLAMLTRAAAFDVAVVALVGERGREVREFLDGVLGQRGARAIVVVATGDESAMMRRQAPYTALAIAEYFRARGDTVLLAVDSVTRFALAAREVALAAGEMPVARGFPPSVFAALPRLLERAGAGTAGEGMMTGLFSILVDGDDHNDPIADSVRGILDGHIVLDRAIAEQGRYPAIDILKSISRLADTVWTREQRQAVQQLKAMAARFEDSRDLRAMGGYTPGSDEAMDRALHLVPQLYGALQQRPDDPPSKDAYAELLGALKS